MTALPVPPDAAPPLPAGGADIDLDLPYYLETGRECALFAAAHARRLPVLIAGPAGCGKSRFVAHMAARLGRPLVPVACHADLGSPDLIGRFVYTGSDTAWADGPLTRAVRIGAVCLLDGLGAARRDVIGVLGSLIGRQRRLVIGATGEVLEAPDGFMLVASDTAAGARPAPLPPEARQRFVALRLDVPAPEAEIAIVARESGLEAGRVAPLVRLAGRIRAMGTAPLAGGVSTRLLVHAAVLMTGGIGVERAILAAIVEPLAEDSDMRRALLAVVASIYG